MPLSFKRKDIQMTLVDARADRTEYSPYINYTYPDNVYYGDTHLHTFYSTDAGFVGSLIDNDHVIFT